MKKYGHIYGYFDGNLPVLMIGNPNLIKQICMKDWPNFVNRSSQAVISTRQHPILCHNVDEAEGRDWKRIRSIMSSAFTSAKIRSMVPKVRQCLKQLTTAMDRYAASGQTIDMKHMYENSVLDTIAACVYSMDLNCSVNPNHPFVININQILYPKWYRTLALLILPQFVLKLIGVNLLSDDTSNEYFFQLTRHVIGQRKLESTGIGGCSGDGKRWDFIELLMEAHAIEDQTINDNNKTTADNEDDYGLYEKGMSKYLTDDEVIANAWFLTTGGYELTVITLSFATYELARNQSVQQKLYDEIRTVIINDDDNDQQLDVDRLHNLPLLEAVVCETLRLHSPAISEGRFVENDYPLGGGGDGHQTGVIVKAGESVEFGIYAMHLNGDYYPNPEQFNVDRFLPENRNQLTPYAFIPFGLGPRQCIAKRFALMIIKLTLATLVLKYRFNTCAQTDIPTKLFYFTRNFDYWSKLGVNGPKPVIGYGNILFRLSKNVNQIDYQWFKKYGKAFGVYKYNVPVLTIVDPELIKRICVTDSRYFYNRGRDPVMSFSEHPVLCQNVSFSTDNTWKQTRKMFTSLMSVSRMKRMSTKVTDDIQVLMNVLDNRVCNTENGSTGTDLKKTMDSFIMYLLIDCFQSQDTGFPSDRPLNKSVGYVMSAVEWSPLLAKLRILLPKFLLRLFGISFLVPNSVANSYVNVINDLIDRRLAAGGVEQNNDFLQDLLSFMSETKKSEDRQQTDSYLTRDEVVGNLYGALIDGYNIVIDVIGQAIDELVRDQQSQRRLYDELAKQHAATAADNDQHIITYDMCYKIKYLEAIINESMRLMTNNLRDGRLAAEDYQLADTGIQVRRGQRIEFPLYPIHLNPDYFPEPHRFDPDRFMGQNNSRDKIVPYTFLPFGAGPRACAGQPFAWLIVKLILANFLVYTALLKLIFVVVNIYKTLVVLSS
ncbi:uncharacterized protein LOC128959218 [Oppia nitens]|uniref:uncharacterized protein LOC128959218 n=1 Tax=Oppia nitens TaxID=1686743 RepID=UPI0023D9DA18|nr:uncharacterized protein LOC128959218 [Oppia nitens]